MSETVSVLAARNINMDADAEKAEIERQKREAQRAKMREDIARRKEQLRLQREALNGGPGSPVAASAPTATEIAPVIAAPMVQPAPIAVAETAPSTPPRVEAEVVAAARGGSSPVVVASSLSPVAAAVLPSVLSPVRDQPAAVAVATTPAAETFATPQKESVFGAAGVKTPSTVRETGAELSFDDSSDDVTIAPHLLGKALVESSPVVSTKGDAASLSPVRTPQTDATEWLTPVKGEAALLLDVTSPPTNTGSRTPAAVVPASVLSPVAVPLTPPPALNIPVASTPKNTVSPAVAVAPKASPGALLTANAGAEPLAFLSPAGGRQSAEGSPSLAFAKSMDVVLSHEETTTPVKGGALSPARGDLNASFQSPPQVEETGEMRAEIPSSLLWGEGLLSPIREETEEYTSDVSSSISTMDARLSVAAVPVTPPQKQSFVAEPTESMPVTPQKVVESGPTTPVKAVENPIPANVVALSPLASTPSQPRAQSDVPATPPHKGVQPLLIEPLSGGGAVVQFNPVTPLVTSPVEVAIKTPASATIATSAVVTAIATPKSQMQEELMRIKQRIRVWDVTSPVKQSHHASPSPAHETRLTTPDKLPKYSEAEMQAERTKAERAAQAESDRLRAEFLELQKQYEQEKNVSKQLRDIVDEFESTVKLMVEGHAKEMEAERAGAAQFISQNTELLALVEDRQRKCGALERERAEVARELEAARAIQNEMQNDLNTVTGKLADTTNKYQALKQQAEKKLALANERIQQQQTVNNEQLMAMKNKLSSALKQVETLEIDLAQKKKENVELVQICDQLVAQAELHAK